VIIAVHGAPYSRGNRSILGNKLDPIGRVKNIVRGGESKMRRRNIIITVVAVVVVVGVVVGVVVSGLGRGEPTEAKILVGVPAPQSGMYSSFGEGGVWGLQAAVEDINAEGGVYVADQDKYLDIELVVGNTESDDTKAGTIAESLILEDEVDFLSYGDQPPPMTAAIANKAEQYGVPYICTTGPMEPYLAMREAAGNWSYTWAAGLFAIGDPGDKGPGYTIADTWLAMLDLVGNETNKIAGVFASDDPDGVGWHDAFPGILEDWGCTVVASEESKSLLPVDTSDFSSLIDEWVSNNVSIIWGNAPAPFVGTLLAQAYATEGFAPELISIGRAPLFYDDVASWTGNTPLGVLVETWWDPAWGESPGVSAPGIGDTTAESLAARYLTDTSADAVNRGIGAGYSLIQVLVDAIERAGTLNADDVCDALAETDLMTIRYRVQFDENQFSRGPLVYSQWQWDDEEEDWVCPIVLSKHDFIETTGEVLFPIPLSP
jgi:branched-chain amino acid transport system substrate-binding protein